MSKLFGKEPILRKYRGKRPTPAAIAKELVYAYAENNMLRRMVDELEEKEREHTAFLKDLALNRT